MKAALVTMIAVFGSLTLTSHAHAEQVHFSENFDRKLSDKWQAKRLPKDYYRVRGGGLEVRVVPGKLSKQTPLLFVDVPLPAGKSVYATASITLLDKFTTDEEFAGICLIDETGPEFVVKQSLVEGNLVYAPGKYVYADKPVGEGDTRNYRVDYTRVSDAAGPLRLLVDRGYAYFQVGPNDKGKFLNFYHSAIRPNVKHRRFAIVAACAPFKQEHWVRFDDFKIVEP